MTRSGIFVSPWIATAALLLLIPTPAEAQPTPLPGLTTESVVFYDSNGVPHICTGSDRDTFLLQGYVHARDRFFQMDLLRRTFSGTLAEMLGPAALPSDIQFRFLGLRRAAVESLAGYQAAGLDDTLEGLAAYVEGINLYLQHHPLPPEYGALELTAAEPWTVVDTLTLGKGLSFGLSFDLLELDLTFLLQAYIETGQALGFDGLALFFEDTTRHAPFDPTVSIPGAAPAAARKKAPEIALPDKRVIELARTYRDRALEVPMLRRALRPSTGDQGSNWWLVAGEKSANGHAMLANDPHLALDTPATFYEAHLISSTEPDCGIQPDGLGGEMLRLAPAGAAEEDAGVRRKEVGLNANGVSFAGAPGLVQGCNDHFCWGSTVNPMDVTDVYQEVLVLDPVFGVPTHTIFDGQPEPLVRIPQSYDVNQLGDGVPDNLADSGIGIADPGGVVLIVPRRNNGPIVAFVPGEPPIGLSVQYTGWRATFEFAAFLPWLKAGGLKDFVDGLQYFDVGSQNFAYADVDGNIAYYTSGELPLREDLQTLGFPDGGIPPFLIRDGTHTLRHEWLPAQGPEPQRALQYEILPFDEMPQLTNPARGYIANANNDPIGTTLDNNVLNQVRPGGGILYLSPGYVSLRMGRIDRLLQDLLDGGGKVTADDMMRIQGNNQLLDAEYLVPFVAAAFANAQAAGAPAELAALAAQPGIAEAVARLMAWDFSTPTGLPQGYDPGDDPQDLQPPSAEEIASSVAATIWSTWRGQAVRRVIDDTLIQVNLGGFLPDSRSAYNALAHHLMSFDTAQGIGASGVDFFHGPAGLTQAQERDFVLLDSLRQALELLASDVFADAFGNSTDQDDYRWGYLHRIVFDHPLGGPFSIPPAGGFDPVSAELPGLARAGGYEAVDASTHSARADGVNEFMFGSGPSRRFVGVLDPAGIDAYEILPGGQSGVLGSPHYASQLGRWLTNRYHPLLLAPEDVAGDVVGREDFGPLCVPSPLVHCFQTSRFRVASEWLAPPIGAGPALAVPGASDASGNFYFFDPGNWELLVKVLDGCAINDHYWVFLAPATGVGWDVTVEDTATGELWTRGNTPSDPEVILDVEAFATCP